MTNENDETTLTLDLDQIETRALALTWGLTSSMSKDGNGNLLLARLSKVFEQEYKSRTCKNVTVTHLPASSHFDLQEYSLQDLRKAYAHFSCLSTAFESNGKRSSSKFCGAIVACISNALDQHCNSAGHA
jgi:hypothetical protein